MLIIFCICRPTLHGDWRRRVCLDGGWGKQSLLNLMTWDEQSSNLKATVFGFCELAALNNRKWKKTKDWSERWACEVSIINVHVWTNNRHGYREWDLLTSIPLRAGPSTPSKLRYLRLFGSAVLPENFGVGYILSTLGADTWAVYQRSSGKTCLIFLKFEVIYCASLREMTCG